MTCRWCGFRDAPPSRLCATCDAVVPDPPESIVNDPTPTLERQKRLQLLARIGPVTATHFADELGVEGRADRLRVSQELSRLAKDGVLEIDRTVRPYRYRRAG